MERIKEVNILREHSDLIEQYWNEMNVLNSILLDFKAIKQLSDDEKAMDRLINEVKNARMAFNIVWSKIAELYELTEYYKDPGYYLECDFEESSVFVVEKEQCKVG